MRERAAFILKIICVGLAAWLAWEFVRVSRDANPLAHVTIPEVPSLPVDTNAPPAVAGKPSAKPGTNVLTAAPNTNAPAIAVGTNGAAAEGTNAPTLAAGTNAPARKRVRPAKTNVVVEAGAAASTNIAAATNVVAATNLAMNPSTNGGAAIVADTSLAAVAVTNTAPSNGPPMIVAATAPTNASGSNVTVALMTNGVVSGTNAGMVKLSGGTNSVGEASHTNLANSAMARASGARPPNAAAMAGMMGGPGGRKPATLPPEIQARVERVYESEIFAPIMHPMPMALLGIAGQVAFLRAPNGQTGLVKEGDNLGDIKLLRIGTNRVLVEQDGNKQELMIFSGFGGDSLLSKTNDSSNETTKH